MESIAHTKAIYYPYMGHSLCHTISILGPYMAHITRFGKGYTKFYAAYIYICFLIEAVYFHKEFSYSVCHVSVQRTFYDLLFSSIVALFCFDCVVIRYPFLASRTKSSFSLVSFMS